MSMVSLSALAQWHGAVSGVIGTVQVTHETNYAFRVSLVGNPTLCGNNHSWAYLNKADSNYETYVSMLMAAKYAKSQVTIHSNRDGSAAGYCRIGHIIVD